MSDILSQILHGGKNALTIADIDEIESPEEKTIAYGLICLAEDVEFHRKRKDEAINNLKTALSSATILAVTDLKGKIKEVNHRFIELTGYEEDELIGSTFDLLNSDFHETSYFSNLWETINEGRVWQGEFRYVNKYGDYFWVDTSIFPITHEGDRIVEFLSISTDKTERIKAEAESESVAKELRQFIETANAPIFGIDSNGLVNEWNQTSEEITGFKKEDVLGKDLVETYITGDYQEAVKNVLDNALNGQETSNYELPLFTKDGRRVIVLLNASTRRNPAGEITGVLGVGQDISEMHALRTESESVAKELRQFIETANAPIFGIDSNGLVNEWNQTSEEITGFKKEDVLGKDLVETYITGDYQEAVKNVLDNALNGQETSNYELPLFTKDGRRVIVLLNASTRRNPAGEITGVLGVGQDITTLNQYKENLENTLLSLEDKNVELERFAFVAAHDLKSPLIGIGGLSQVLSETYSSQLDTEGREMLRLLSRTSDTLRNLIDGLLEYSRCESVLKENKSQVKFNGLIDELSGLFSYEPKLTLQLKTSLTEMRINKAVLMQVLINLVTNAIKYNDKENVEIEIGVSASTTHYEFYVQDNGSGISPKYHETIFDLFETIVSKDRYGMKGNGIGLAAIKKLVEKSGGSIKVESALTKGAKFLFAFKK
ncbi:MAG: PAS domain S-box protein [Rubripirellula sp.]|nr:PAS domain S-box protein [Rubripirellula sp.]